MDENLQPNLSPEKLAECKDRFPHAQIDNGLGELLGSLGTSAGGHWVARWQTTSGKETLDLCTFECEQSIAHLKQPSIPLSSKDWKAKGRDDMTPLDFLDQERIKKCELILEHFGRMAHTAQTAYLFDLLLALRTEKLRLETALKMHDEYKTKIMAALTALAISIGTFLANFFSDIVVKEL